MIFKGAAVLEQNLQNNKAKEREYIDSGSWRCDKSPSGAHHWIVIGDQMNCKHCNINRQVSVPPQPYTK
jgi:hypothetical protein